MTLARPNAPARAAPARWPRPVSRPRRRAVPPRAAGAATPRSRHPAVRGHRQAAALWPPGRPDPEPGPSRATAGAAWAPPRGPRTAPRSPEAAPQRPARAPPSSGTRQLRRCAWGQVAHLSPQADTNRPPRRAARRAWGQVAHLSRQSDLDSPGPRGQRPASVPGRLRRPLRRPPNPRRRPAWGPADSNRALRRAWGQVAYLSRQSDLDSPGPGGQRPASVPGRLRRPLRRPPNHRRRPAWGPADSNRALRRAWGQVAHLSRQSDLDSPGPGGQRPASVPGRLRRPPRRPPNHRRRPAWGPADSNRALRRAWGQVAHLSSQFESNGPRRRVRQPASGRVADLFPQFDSNRRP